MTTQTPNTIHFGNLGKGRGWKDLFVVAFLAVMLGAFVAEISSPSGSPAPTPIAAAAPAAAAHG